MSRERRRRRTRGLAVMALALLLVGAVETRAQDSGTGPARTVSADERLGDILGPPPPGEEAPARDSRVARDPSFGGALLRVLGWTALVVALGVALMLLLKRYTAFGRQLNGGGALRVVGRTALSPKHSVYLLRLGNQRLLAVGVSGDRMVTLSEIDDPAGILACDGEFRAALAGFEGEGEAAPGSTPRERLLPYQREVRRVRDALRNWRGIFDGRAPGALAEKAEEEGALSETDATMARARGGEALET